MYIIISMHYAEFLMSWESINCNGLLLLLFNLCVLDVLVLMSSSVEILFLSCSFKVSISNPPITGHSYAYYYIILVLQYEGLIMNYISIIDYFYWLKTPESTSIHTNAKAQKYKFLGSTVILTFPNMKISRTTKYLCTIIINDKRVFPLFAATKNRLMRMTMPQPKISCPT